MSTIAHSDIPAFKDLGIKSKITKFTGDRISPLKLLNTEIIFLFFAVEASKYPEKGDGKRVRVQIELKGEHRIFFSSSIVLRDLLSQVKAFPIRATMVIENERLELK